MLGNSPQYAIQFGKGIDKGLEKQTVFPFLYTMVQRENDYWERDKATANLTG